MEKGEKIFEEFNNLSPIATPEGWNEGLMQKLNRSSRTSGNSFANKIILSVVIALITINVLAFSGYWLQQKSGQTSREYKNIAGEFLVSTDSSKY